MPNVTEPRYKCPVCLGLPMQKLKITQKGKEAVLTLDCCKRCGGVWFDQDEVRLSQQIKSSKVRQHITQKPRKWMIHCHSCNTLMDRNLEQCEVCGWHNQIHCPVCEQPLQRKHHKHLILDICHSCQGVWFDQTELTSLWDQSLPENKPENKKSPDTQPCQASSNINNYSITPNESTHHGMSIIGDTIGQVIVEGGIDPVLQGGESLAQYMVTTVGNVTQSSAQTLATPEISGSVVDSLAEVTGAALESVGEMPELVIGVLEVTGEMAAGMTEFLADVIAGLFSS
ncbi:MAG: hypothetical protein F6K11_22975 [Leptolyngbya sp. SIO3F4]|nr:hypothetical protein [Leptolyngbya sp. SIO3F4]